MFKTYFYSDKFSILSIFWELLRISKRTWLAHSNADNPFCTRTHYTPLSWILSHPESQFHCIHILELCDQLLKYYWFALRKLIVKYLEVIIVSLNQFEFIHNYSRSLMWNNPYVGLCCCKDDSIVSSISYGHFHLYDRFG